jgi:hypothetical protein
MGSEEMVHQVITHVFTLDSCEVFWSGKPVYPSLNHIFK